MVLLDLLAHLHEHPGKSHHRYKPKKYALNVEPYLRYMHYYQYYQNKYPCHYYQPNHEVAVSYQPLKQVLPKDQYGTSFRHIEHRLGYDLATTSLQVHANLLQMQNL